MKREKNMKVLLAVLSIYLCISQLYADHRICPTGGMQRGPFGMELS